MCKGYVYILEVADIDLPVCKIGRTSKNPVKRCKAINRSSTGDFLWEVAYAIEVSDHIRFERLIHEKLDPLRQKNREFFNVAADVAYTAVKSIFDGQEEIKEIEPRELGYGRKQLVSRAKPKKSQRIQADKRHLEYADLLALFTKLTNCKGRPFGQLNKPYFGMSDGNKGVQWNIAIDTQRDEIRLGVNLEGMKYLDWPIRSFLMKEANDPDLFSVRDSLTDPGQVYVWLTRDAWQGAARPSIVEGSIGPKNVSLTKIDPKLWESMLAEALECLSADNDYRGRAQQEVTYLNQPKSGPRTRSMEVSPHLTVWTPVEKSKDAELQLTAGINRLRPVYEWVSRRAQS